MRILVAIPAYRCENQIERVLRGFRDTPALLKRVERIVVIDNQSPDHTVERANAAIREYGLGERSFVVRNQENYGLGGSHKVALKMAHADGFDYLGIVHGDDQATTSELLELIAIADADRSLGAVLGSRFSVKSRLEGYQKLRIYGNRVLNGVYTALTLRWTEDLGSGLNLFKVGSLPFDDAVRFSDSFTFNMDLLLYLYEKGARVCFHPITWTETDQVSNARTFKVGWTALKTVLQWRIGTLPIRHDPRFRYECAPVGAT